MPRAGKSEAAMASSSKISWASLLSRQLVFWRLEARVINLVLAKPIEDIFLPSTACAVGRSLCATRPNASRRQKPDRMVCGTRRSFATPAPSLGVQSFCQTRQACLFKQFAARPVLTRQLPNFCQNLIAERCNGFGMMLNVTTKKTVRV